MHGIMSLNPDIKSAGRGWTGDNHNRRRWGRDVNFDLRDLDRDRIARDDDAAGQNNSRTKASDIQ
jgi:hypothetical protein